jgi:hypothetical protein
MLPRYAGMFPGDYPRCPVCHQPASRVTRVWGEPTSYGPCGHTDGMARLRWSPGPSTTLELLEADSPYQRPMEVIERHLTVGCAPHGIVNCLACAMAAQLRAFLPGVQVSPLNVSEATATADQDPLDDIRWLRYRMSVRFDDDRADFWADDHRRIIADLRREFEGNPDDDPPPFPTYGAS